jgi:hypothetical protein
MNLDEKHYCILVRRHKGWRYARWFQLIASVINIGVGIFFLSQAHRRASKVESWDEEVVLFYPIGFVLFAVGTMLIALAITNWRGDPVVSLLLMLLRKTGNEPQDERGDATSKRGP